MFHRLIDQKSNGRATINLQTFVSGTSGITFGLPVIFNHGFVNFNPLTSYFDCGVYLINSVAERGYVPGNVITPFKGVTLEINSTQLIAHIEDGGVFFIRKDNGKDAKISPNRWNLIIKAIAV